jgi:hypothetical protein
LGKNKAVFLSATSTLVAIASLLPLDERNVLDVVPVFSFSYAQDTVVKPVYLQ